MTKPPDLGAEIIRLHYAEHWPVGTIARQLDVHPDVVRRALGRLREPGASLHRRSSLVEPYVDFIEQTLRQYPTLRATRLHDMLRERGFAGSVRTLRDYVAPSDASTIRASIGSSVPLRGWPIKSECAWRIWCWGWCRRRSR